MNKVLNVFEADRETLAQAWKQHCAKTLNLGPVGEKVVPMRLQALKLDDKVKNQAHALNELHYAINEYKAVLLDILDEAENVNTIEELRQSLGDFDIEVKEGNVIPLRVWRAGQLAREAGKGYDHFKETTDEG